MFANSISRHGSHSVLKKSCLLGSGILSKAPGCLPPNQGILWDLDFLHKGFLRLPGHILKNSQIHCHFFCCNSGEVCAFAGFEMSSKGKKNTMCLARGGCWCLLEQRSYETCYPCWSPKLLKFFSSPLGKTLCFWMQNLHYRSFPCNI